jgi:hypothetical protein
MIHFGAGDPWIITFECINLVFMCMKTVGSPLPAEENNDQTNTGNSDRKADYYHQGIEPVPEEASDKLD